ncbi:hypothetical protein ACFQH8_00435 [Halomicroarcula sp. GCM10025710]
MTLALQSADTAMLLQEGSELLGLAIAVATVSGLVALLYRWYVREHVPNGLAVLFGLTVVALYLGTTTALGQVIGGQEDVLEPGRPAEPRRVRRRRRRVVRRARSRGPARDGPLRDDRRT